VKHRFLGRLTAACLILALPQLLVACRSPATAAPPAPQDSSFPQPDEFRFSVGDQLEIQVWREPELTTEQFILPDGTVTPRLLQPLHVAGLSIPEVRAQLEKLYSKDYLTKPTVSVRVTSVHNAQIFLLGEVAAPGALPMRGPTSILQAVSQAGGFNESVADKTTLRIIRPTPSGCPKVLAANAQNIIAGCSCDIMLAPGDVVFVHRTGLAHWTEKLVQALAPLNAVLQPLGSASATYLAVDNVVNNRNRNP